MADRIGETPEITPQVVHLVDLLKWAREGRLRVPRFQRDFVWRRQDIVDLFDSIANQYPVGTLFLWGAEPMPASRNTIGPLRLPNYKGQTWLVLDGQQRLTTLVGVLLRGESQWSEELDKEDPERWKLFYDAGTGTFTHASRTEPQPDSYVAAPALLDTLKFFAEVQRILGLVQGREGDEPVAKVDAALWVNRAQEVARAIQGYRVPIVQFTTNSLTVAVESFSRLNKKGRGIGQDEMFSALTYEEGNGISFHLAGEIDKLQKEMIHSAFGEVDRTILLRAVLTAAGLDIYRTDWSSLGQQVKADTKKQLPAAVEEAGRGLEKAREFLRKLGVLNARMLPYSMQLVALSAFFGRCKAPTDGQESLLRRWFWYSSFAGWFGSGNPARVRRLVDELRDRLPNLSEPRSLINLDIEQPALPTPLRFDLRSARVRAQLCVLLQGPLLKPTGEPLAPEDAAQLLLERGPEAMSVLCATVIDPNLRKSPANRILDLAPSASRGQAKNWLISISPEVRDHVLESHAIEPESFALLRDGKHDEFLTRRLKYFGQLERTFMRKFGVTLPTTEEAAPSPIDTEGSPPLGMDDDLEQTGQQT